MEMLVSNKARDALYRQLGGNHSFILASRTEDNQKLRDRGCCAKGSYFQIVPIYGKSQKYNQSVENEAFQFFTSTDDQAILGEKIELDYCDDLNSFILESSGGVVDYNMKLKNYFFS
ncbi:iron-sulfur cluster biosynthesis family protein [Enterococcus sp.]|uniref:iron-sulfur cluster biosynthesis family protein n=1 Tax=Enterococcus sp. TaxID=35783 RepID=UPI002906360C|nr:iron-sulfur cluster biosynthesis family protein [Enterococcus sp.]MDU5333134.1 iron-sulfur cluster biosynthesis family protein [Enterococcus sp.]